MDINSLKGKLHTKLIGKEIHFHGETPSTNDEAKRLARAGAGEGTVVIAGSQLNGRGKLGRTWFSPKGKGIYLSIIIEPFKSQENLLPLTLLGALSAARALNGLTDLGAKVKWPNDIMVSGKKIGGVLTETLKGPRGTNPIIIGIGLNIYTEKTGLPEELKTNTTSLTIEGAKKVPIPKLITTLLEEMEKLYFLMLANKSDQIIDEWKILCETVGRHIKIRAEGATWEGKVTDIGDDGELIIKTFDGRIKWFATGDIIK